MRTVLALALLGGCAPSASPLAIEHRSSLGARVSGLAVSDDGEIGQAGMFGTTCEFLTSNAVLDTDYDFPGTDEEVQDGTDDPTLGFVTLTVSHVGVHVTVPDDGAADDVDLGAAPVQGRLVDGGMVVLIQQPSSCVARWLRHGWLVPGPRVDVPDAACDPDADVGVDREAAELFVTTPEGVLVIGEDGWTRLDVQADLLSYDPWAGALYTARRGDSQVSAWERDGSARWSVDVAGAVEDVAHVGAEASAAVTVGSSGNGGLVILDGATGAERLDEPTPSAASEIVGAGGGGLLGLVVHDEVHFYDVVVP